MLPAAAQSAADRSGKRHNRFSFQAYPFYKAVYDMGRFSPPNRIADIDDVRSFYGFFDGAEVGDFWTYLTFGRGFGRPVFLGYAAAAIGVIKDIWN